MNRLILTITAVTLCFAGYAQNDSSTYLTKKNFRHEIGVNATFFIKNLVSFSNSNIAFSPYLVTYKYVAPTRWAFRFGMGASYLDDTQNQNGQTIGTQNIDANTRWGFEYQIPVARKWTAWAGFDAVFDFSKEETITNSGFDIVKITNTIYRFGGGPVLGIMFKPTKRISIYTETSLYYRRSAETERQKSQLFPEFDVSTHTGGNSIIFLVPTSLFFTIHF